MGQCPRNHGDLPGGDPISAPNIHNMETASGREFEYSNDVYTDPGKLCLGGQSGGKIWVGGLEHVGDISCDGHFARVSVGHGHHV